MTQLELSLENASTDGQEIVTKFLTFKAPFASFRPFQSGSFRSTTPIPAPSTVYGMLLNLAGIEQRADLTTPVTLIKDNLPNIELAIGLISSSEIAVLSQQLHNYPVGDSGKILAKKTHGAKYWIAPVRREVLVELNFVVGIKVEKKLFEQLKKGLSGELNQSRYGLPFAGDNNFLFDEITIDDKPQLARWYCPLNKDSCPNRGVCRLTTWIDRGDNTKTLIQVFSPSEFRLQPPESGWLQLPIKDYF